MKHIHRAALALMVSLSAALATFTGAPASAQVLRPPSRLRLGIEGGVGGDWGRPRGPSIGLFGQVGVQVNRTFAIYYQPSVYAHALGANDDSPTYAAFGHVALGDVTVGPLQLGAGGGFDVGRFSNCVGNLCTIGDLSIHPVIAGRVALVLSLPAVRGRLGIPFALQVHSTRLDEGDRLTSLLLTVGVQRF